MDVDAKWRMISEQRVVLADLAAALPAGDLDRPSLCGRWRVRDVVAHVAFTPRSPGLPRILAAAVRARGDFDEVNRVMAVGHADRLGAGVAAELRAVAPLRDKPAITTLDNLVFDTLVHVQDVALPLGLEVTPPLDGLRAGAERVWRMGWPFWARRRLRGLQLVATDTSWVRGDGEPVHGSIRDLLLLLTGRTQAALPRLEGPGVRRLATT
ncbi:maleylpyruvate isomerase family mycothiol-dependent enzyme [Actinomycetospora straminea]|uniref:Maleylpyruvate isomerase family mycothiol-dependent enzyme n=1 Tax=Actinomycetospora straminea TaxID=663607 RepID=A0ABP9EJ54_9PSEU|nr:maleylpyruvate isomerase family mycothiol-dependent enzyme [Actinomycetospora straminea]MDD7933896.1 maleylpyruvate isomerase family mycothiol-dependent enzyme [Actinomycetospora straminea]